MATEPILHVVRLRGALDNLQGWGQALSNSAYTIDSKRETSRVPRPREEDYAVAYSDEPLTGDDELPNSWAMVLRRLRHALTNWWKYWDQSNFEMKMLSPETEAVLSGAFKPYWRLNLSKLLVDLGSAVGATRPSDIEPPGKLDLYAFVTYGLPKDWQNLVQEIPVFSDHLIAMYNAGVHAHPTTVATVERSPDLHDPANNAVSSTPAGTTGEIIAERNQGRVRRHAGNQVGRPSKAEKDSVTKVLSGLAELHSYENGSVVDADPRSVAEIAITSKTSETLF